MNRHSSLLSILGTGLCAVISGCGGSSSTDSLERFGLVGDIESVRTTINYGEGDEGSYLAEFSPKGLLTRVTNYAPDSSVFFSTKYEYDSKGRVTNIWEADMSGEEIGEYRYTYKGDFLSLCIHLGEANEEDCRWEHENDGKHIVKTVFYSEGALETISENTWDGMTRREVVKSPEDSLIGTAEYVYLSKDKPLRITSDNTDISIEYNEKGLPSKCVNVLLTTDGNLRWDPRIVQGEENIYKYEYDSKGNWIRRTEYLSKAGILSSDISRTITYR